MASLTLVNSAKRLIVDDEDVELLKDCRLWLGHGGRYVSAYRRGYHKHSVPVHVVLMGKGSKRAYIDHIDGDPLNNSRANLRIVTPFESLLNRHVHHRQNKSGVRGVSWEKRRHKWHAAIGVNRRSIGLGDYAIMSDAVQARAAAELKYFGQLCPTTKAAVTSSPL